MGEESLSFEEDSFFIDLTIQRLKNRKVVFILVDLLK